MYSLPFNSVESVNSATARFCFHKNSEFRIWISALYLIISYLRSPKVFKFYIVFRFRYNLKFKLIFPFQIIMLFGFSELRATVTEKTDCLLPASSFVVQSFYKFVYIKVLFKISIPIFIALVSVGVGNIHSFFGFVF